MGLDPRNKLAAAITRVTGLDPYHPDPAKRGLAPYFGAVLRGLVRRETPGLGTIGVSKQGVLYWDPAFVERVKAEELAAGLIHEVMHVVLKHCERGEALGVFVNATSDRGERSYIANMAMDLTINPEVQQIAPLPPGCLFPEKFGLPKGLTMEDYYHRLLKKVDEIRASAGDKDGPNAGQGWCGSCAGHALPQEPETKGGKDEDARSEAEMERMRKQVAEDVRSQSSSKGRGTVPASLQRWADQMLAPPKIPWREKLARLVRGAIAYKSGAVDLTWNRPSRRQAGVGFGLGCPVVPALHAPVPSVAVVVDTSGSMGDEELKAAASELNGVLAAVGAKVVVVACDADVHGIRECRTIAEAVALFKGGGGTSMTPAMEALLTRRPMPQVVVILTDGEIGDGYLQEEPPYKVVWCVVGGAEGVPCPYGDVVVVSEDDECDRAG